MENDQPRVVYWDASAILSVLFMDCHSEQARVRAHEEGVHLISSLAYAETCTVIARLRREDHLAELLIQAACEVLENGPWRSLTVSPERDWIQSLSLRWPLRGADLWHLSTAKSLQRQLPELIFLTFDSRLREAAEGERLLCTV